MALSSAVKQAAYRSRKQRDVVVRVRAERVGVVMLAAFSARDRLMESGRADRAVAYVEKMGC